MKSRILLGLAVALAVAVPAQARAGSFSGVVVAKQPSRGAFVLVGARGIGITVRGVQRSVVPGARLRVEGLRLRDGTVRMTQLVALGRMHRATIRGTVVRRLAHVTLVATGRSVVSIRNLATRRTAHVQHDGPQAGDVAQFRVRFDDDDLVEAGQPVQVGQAGAVRIEGTIVSVAPLVVSVEGLPVTITVPAGMTLASTLAAGARIELTVQVGAGNVFTLSSIDEQENAENGDVEVKGAVVSSTTTQLVVSSGGTTFTFVAPTGATLPVLATGTSVEVRGFARNGVTVLERLRLEDESGDGDGGDHGGDDGGGHH